MDDDDGDGNNYSGYGRRGWDTNWQRFKFFFQKHQQYFFGGLAGFLVLQMLRKRRRKVSSPEISFKEFVLEYLLKERVKSITIMKVRNEHRLELIAVVKLVAEAG